MNPTAENWLKLTHMLKKNCPQTENKFYNRISKIHENCAESCDPQWTKEMFEVKIVLH